MTPTAQTPLFAGPSVLALGIDPGSVVTGWGLVRKQGRQIEHVDSGTLQPDESDALAIAICAAISWRIDR